MRNLVSTNPFNPRLAKKLYTLSNFGLQEKYVGKFTGARSIQQATITAWNNENDELTSVGNVESLTSHTLENKQNRGHIEIVRSGSSV